MQGSLIKYKQSLQAKETDKNTVIGPNETMLNASLSKLKVNKERHFNGDAMTGNSECNIYKAIENNDFSIPECFSEQPQLRSNFNELWKILTKYNKYLAIRSPTREQVEEAAKNCEKFCLLFPTFFPNKNLTPKMVELSLVIPTFLRTKPILMNHMFRLEQEGEHLHNTMNKEERTLKNICKREERYFKMIQNHENKIYCKSEVAEN